MANIELNIVALGDFTAVNAQIKALQAQVTALNSSLGVGSLSPQLTAGLKTATNDFSNALVASSAFTKQTVQLTSETTKFGQALENGKLGLGNYFQIISGKSGAATQSVRQLALEQTKLQNSVIMADPSKQGFYSVFTPTTINAAANATKIAANEANIYAMAVNKGSQALINFGKNTQWAGRQLTVGMSMPMILFGSQAVKSFNDTNKALTQLQKVYGEGLIPPSQGQIDQVSKQVLDLGKRLAQTTGISQQFTVEVASSFAAMGKMGDQLTQATEQTVRLAKLGNLTQDVATRGVIALQNVYKLSTTQLGDAVNYFASIQKQTSLSMNDLIESESKVGPIIDQLGGSYRDTAVMILAMKEAGVPAAQSANALKSAFASIIAPTTAAKKEFQQFGINLNAIKSAGGPVQMIEQLQAGLKNLTPLVREQLIEKLFGKYQFSRISALLDNFNKVGSQTANAIKVAGASSSELTNLANQEMKQATSSPSAQWQIALNTFKADLYPVGQMIMKIGTDVLKFANGVAKAFGSLPGPVKLVLGVLLGFVAISGPIIMLTGLLANFAGNILKGVFNLKQLITGGKTLGQLLTPELIAAQNASDLFSKGVMGDADAIKLLNEQIVILTNNLDNLVGKMATGAGLPGITGVLKTEVDAVANGAIVAEQLRLPGFADGGTIRGPGTGTSDSIIARVSNGETILTEEQTKKYHPIVQAMLTNNLPGYADGNKNAIDSLYGGRQFAHLGGNLMSGNQILPSNVANMTPEQKAQVLSMFPKGAGSAEEIKNSFGVMWPSAINQMTSHGTMNIEDMIAFLTGKPINLPSVSQGNKRLPATTAVDDERAYEAMMQTLNVPQEQRSSAISNIRQGMVEKLKAAQTSGATHLSDTPGAGQVSGNILGEGAESSIRGMGYNSGMNEMLQPAEARQQQGSKRRVFVSKPKSATEWLLKARGKGSVPLAEEGTSAAQMRNSVITATDLEEIKKQGSQATKAFELGIKQSSQGVIVASEELAKAPLNAVKKELDINSPSGSFANQVGKPIVEGMQQGYQEALPGFENIVKTSMSEIPNNSQIINAWTKSGEQMSNAVSEGIISNTGAVEAAASEVADKASITMSTRLKGAMTGTMGKTGGIGLAMMLPMLTGMLPKSVGGQNISGLTGAATTAASAGLGVSMLGMGAAEGSMMATIGGLALPIAGVVGALGLLKLGIDSVNNANREAKNVIQETYGKNAVTTSYFNLSSSNISQFDFSGLISGVKQSTSSIQENKAAVDALTAAYANATDQMTKDYLNQIKSSNPTDLQDMMKARYGTNLAQGMKPEQALQDISASLKAGGKDSLTRQFVLSGIGSKSTDNAATGFKSAIETALAPYETQKTSIKNSNLTLRRPGVNPQGLADSLKTSAIKDIATELLNVAATTPANLKLITDSFKSAGGETAKALANSNGVFKELRNQVQESNPSLATWMDKMYKAGLSTTDMAKAISLLNSNIVQTPEQIAKATDSAKTWAANIEKLFLEKKTQDIVSNKNPNVIDNTSTTPFTGTPAEKALQKLLQGNLTAQNAQLKIARDQLTVQNKISQEAKQQLQYQQQITGLQNDMKTAMISGNYLQAASLRQQISSTNIDFNATSIQTKMQNQVDKLQSNSDQINQALSDLKDAIGNGTTTINKTILAAKSLPIMRAQQIVGGVSGGASVNTIININGPVDQKAINAVSTAVSTAVKSGTKVKSSIHTVKQTAGKTTKKGGG